MTNYLRTILIFGFTTLKRNIRDPLTVIILYGIPVALLVIFGLLYGNNQNLNIRAALINSSETEFSKSFVNTLKEVDVLEINESITDTNQAQEQMKNGELDTVIELPANFGELNESNIPSGEIIVYNTQTDAQTGQIVQSIMGSVADNFNRELVGSETPLNVTARSIDGNDVRAIHYVFPMFTGLGVLLSGALGIASAMPGDRKHQILRRLKATPIKKSQVVLGTGLAFSILSVILAIIMTSIAVFFFNMNIQTSSLINLGVFILIGIIAMTGLGLAIGSWAKNPTQGESVGQVIFLASMGLSGIWFPVAMMPEFLQSIVFFMPLTPIIDGLRFIIIDNASLLDLLPQLGVILVWTVISLIASFKLFKWE